MLSFLKRKGFSEEQVLEDLVKEGAVQIPPNRDDFGLPIPPMLEKTEVRGSTLNPFKDKMKSKLEDTGDSPPLGPVDQVFDKPPMTGSHPVVNCDAHGNSKSDTVKRMWVQKAVKAPTIATAASTVASIPPADDNPVQTVKMDEPVIDTGGSSTEATVPNSSVSQEIAAPTEPDKEDWTTVHRKKAAQIGSSSLSGQSDTPIFIAIAKSLSKGQLKKAKKALGRNSPNKK
ncbi:hypothetical protein ACET3Z_021307 [Daucus carota]